MDTSPETITLTPGPAIAIREEVAIADLPGFFGRAFGELAACAADRIAGPPFARYHHFDTARVDVEAVMPVRAPVEVRGRVTAIELAGGPAVQIQHTGPYEELATTYASIEHWMEDHHQARADAVREVYLNNPGEVRDPTQYLTLVIQPVHEHAAP